MAETMDFVQFWALIGGAAWLAYVEDNRWIRVVLVFIAAILGLGHGGIYG